MKNEIVKFIKNHIISVYFIIAFMLSGILFSPYVFLKFDTSGFVLPQLAPGLTAILMLRFIYSKDEAFKYKYKIIFSTGDCYLCSSMYYFSYS